MSADKPPIDPTQLWEIHGKYYDLDPFLKTHPGGRRFLEQSRGMDCTALFESIHLHDKIPKASLRKFYVCDKDDHEPDFDWDPDGFYMTVKARVREYFSQDAQGRGLSGRAMRYAHHGTRAFVVRLVLFWLVWAAVSVGAVYYGQWWCAVLWGPLAFALGGYGHEAMHGGVFGSVRANRVIAFMTLDVNGLSSYVFTAMHVPLHHIHTNVADIDPDIEVHFPTVRERPNQPLFWFHRFQHLYAWMIYFITFPVLWVVDIISISTGVWFGPFGPMRRPYAREVAWFGVFKMVSLGLWYVLPYLLHPWPTALLINAVMVGSAGLVVQTTFALNHQNELAMNLEERRSAHPRDWGAQQLETTADFHHGHWLPVTFFGGLGFQIEHHLFPTLSYSRLAEVAPIVRKTCEEFDVPYFYYPNIGRAIAAHYRFLRRMGRAPSGAQGMESRVDAAS
jgi:linoleoyl-CoA desaturase